MMSIPRSFYIGFPSEYKIFFYQFQGFPDLRGNFDQKTFMVSEMRTDGIIHVQWYTVADDGLAAKG